MKPYGTFFLLAFLALLACCEKNNNQTLHSQVVTTDSLMLARMIEIREESMIKKDIRTAMNQFSDDATWINSQGYYFEGKEEVSKFHAMLSENDSLDYYYEAGKPRIRIVDSKNAIVYYSWKMFWYKKAAPTDTTFREVGLMTLNAHKQKDRWQWNAVTNQHTPWFYQEIEPVTAE